MSSSIWNDLKEMAAELGVKSKGDAVRFGIGFVLLIALTVVGCAKINRWAGFEDDHHFEELIEDHIGDAIGVDVDLTPDSSECEHKDG